MTSITSLPPNLQTLLTEASQPGADLSAIKGKLLKEIDSLPAEQVGSILKFLATQSEGQDGNLLDIPGANGRKDAGGANEAMKNLNSETMATDIYSVMALIQKLAQEQRNSARAIRDSNLEQQVSQMKSAADEIRNAAQDRFVGAVVAGAMQIAGGVVQMGSAVASGIKSAQAASKLTEANQASKSAVNAQNDIMELRQNSKGLVDKELRQEFSQRIGDLKKQSNLDTANANFLKSQADDLSTKAGNRQAFGQGASGLLGGIGGIVNASQERKASEHDAKKSELETSAKISDTNMQQANDFMQQMMDMIRDVRDKLSAIEQSNVETNRGIARNI
ncbi:MAG: type III secretion system translocon subunit SctB [Bordetella sp.]|uniref:type III secretion system translocon subunit SctB n=1 Tax=Bordetella sp. TaxID=28081 RepID=UPI003F7CCFC0